MGSRISSIAHNRRSRQLRDLIEIEFGLAVKCSLVSKAFYRRGFQPFLCVWPIRPVLSDFVVWICLLPQLLKSPDPLIVKNFILSTVIIEFTCIALAVPN